MDTSTNTEHRETVDAVDSLRDDDIDTVPGTQSTDGAESTVAKERYWSPTSSTRHSSTSSSESSPALSGSAGGQTTSDQTTEPTDSKLPSFVVTLLAGILGALLTIIMVSAWSTFFIFLNPNALFPLPLVLVFAVALRMGSRRYPSASVRPAALIGVGSLTVLVVTGNLSWLGIGEVFFYYAVPSLISLGLVAYVTASSDQNEPRSSGSFLGQIRIPVLSRKRGLRGIVRTPKDRIKREGTMKLHYPSFRLEQLDDHGNRVGYVSVVLWPSAMGTINANDDVIVWGRRRRGKPFKATKLKNLSTGEVLRRHSWTWWAMMFVLLAIGFTIALWALTVAVEGLALVGGIGL